MGLQLPGRRNAASRRQRVTASLMLVIGALMLAGCSSDTEAGRLGMPAPVTVEGESNLELWQGAWIAALATGVVVWGLIFYAVVRFRRRSDDEIPVQTRYNLPLEIFYTIFPVIMVIVFFSHTVRVQNVLLDDSPPDNELTIVGQQWQWTFNHPLEEGGQEENVYEVGAGNYIPTLYLPVDETTRFNLYSPDVIHDFGVPGFLMKMDVIPGQVNSFQVTPQTEGDYLGKCYELCGVSHSRMLFNVKVVSRAEYDDYLEQQAAAGNVSDEPVLGGAYANTQVGLEDEASEEGSE
ncbi:aa3-type cytochrome oxidase subunit II [Nocardioides sp. AX2bis]|uniref:aa3-type cytochrome oxidase subunit II n=1 Tax=Nocardioides sp. AX2bis TaxID=2653157 RepID=UPI0012F136DE|nr:cytochrome c oxidase subunit II [Nocardioides sp. AX2bis]VXB73858.1 putative cytochrome c oxidase subunit 2 [Nocardioides sp. AX2bis]